MDDSLRQASMRFEEAVKRFDTRPFRSGSSTSPNRRSPSNGGETPFAVPLEFVPSRWNLCGDVYRRPFVLATNPIDAEKNGSFSKTASYQQQQVHLSYVGDTMTMQWNSRAPKVLVDTSVTNDSFGMALEPSKPPLKQQLLLLAPDTSFVYKTVPDEEKEVSTGGTATSPSPAVPSASSRARGASASASPSTGRSMLKPGELGLTSRFIRHRCNASNIGTIALLVGISKVLVASKGRVAPLSSDHVVTSLNMSNTVFGTQGLRRPPMKFDKDGNELNAPEGNAKTTADMGGFWIDEAAAGLIAVSKRQLALAIVMPLLFVPRPKNFCIREFYADKCELTDADAVAIGTLLRHPNDENFHCALEILFLRNNRFTNVGADAIKKASKYTKLLIEVRLDGNQDISDFSILRTLEKRLEENRKHANLRMQVETRKIAANGSPT